ncbi:MAG TPA: hypothetical protein PLR74_17850 [Agriterribacter sp.]|nr:hypothetical protein [Agriterribacter sp.]
MQKIELTNKQYRLLLQLVALGVDMIDNAALGDDDDEEEEENDEGSALLNDATDLEDFLMAQSKRFGIKDIIRYDADEDYLEYTGPFMEEHEMIAHSAYFNKTAEIASFRLGMRDYKEVNGTDALECKSRCGRR